VIHADLSEYNVVLKSDGHVLIIDWPQFVRVDHPNADVLLRRDVRNILRFFLRRYGVMRDVDSVLKEIKGMRC